MTEKRRLKIDMNELSAAFELHFPETTAYLDLETGEVSCVTDETRWLLKELYSEMGDVDGDFIVALKTRLQQRPDILEWQRQEILNAALVEAYSSSRFIAIEPEPYAGYNDMEDFIFTVEDDCLADELNYAIHGRGAFRRFKNLLARHPRVQQAWYDFKDERDEQRMYDWLDYHNIEPVSE
ncbi:MAG: hypothetical protein J7M17_00740 [Anaerolineae bacterium]|nr:hypothetical protein [Anaerolineae bacterium]